MRTRGRATDQAELRHGRYTADGRFWFDDARGGWFRVGAPVERLEVGVEDGGHDSLIGSVVTTLTGHFGAQVYRFVARRSSTDTGKSTYLTSEGFPILPLALGPGAPIPDAGGWPDEARHAFDQLGVELVARGWRRVGTGERWWSAVYERPTIDWDAPVRVEGPDAAA